VPVILNWYVNSFGGDGDYSNQYALPPINDTTAEFTGIYGRVAALRLNALQIKRDPATRKLFIDQSMMQNFCSPKAHVQWLNAARLCLRDLYATRNAVSDRFILFEDADNLKDAVSAKFTTTHTESFCVWPEDATRSFFNRLIHYRMNRLNALQEHIGTTFGQTHAYLLRMFISSHMGIHYLFDTEHRVSAFSLRIEHWNEVMPALHRFAEACVAHASGAPKTVKLSKKAAAAAAANNSTELTVENALGVLCSRASFSQWNPKAFGEQVTAALASNVLRKDILSFLHSFLVMELCANVFGAAPVPSFALRTKMYRDMKATDVIARSGKNGHVLLMLCIRAHINRLVVECPALHALCASSATFEAQRVNIETALTAVRTMVVEANDWSVAFSDECTKKLNTCVRTLTKGVKPKKPKTAATAEEEYDETTVDATTLKVSLIKVGASPL
jgi:hypothetical protein